MTGSAIIRFFTSGRGELKREFAGPRGEVTFWVNAERSHRSNWQSSPITTVFSYRTNGDAVWEIQLPAVAKRGFSFEPQPNALTWARCALSSITGWPGLRMSRICISDPSI